MWQFTIRRQLNADAAHLTPGWFARAGQEGCDALMVAVSSLRVGMNLAQFIDLH